MSWLRNLVLGVFTRHVRTKVLALLLSVGLFGFVQASLTAVREIPKLRLRFNLAPELRDEYVLLTEEISFGGLTITGERSKVDPLERVYRLDSVTNLAIDKKFLDVYGDEGEGEEMLIRIDREFFADDRLFGRDIAVGNLPDDVAVVLDKIDTRPARVEFAPEVLSVVLPPNHEYEGKPDGKLDLSLDVTSVMIEGPASAFTADPVAVVSVKAITDELSKVQIPGERGEAKLSPVEILWKGIATKRLPQLRITAPGMSRPMSVAEFQERLVVSCKVTKRRKSKSLQRVPIEIRYPLPQTFNVVEDYQVYGSTIIDGDLREGRMQQLDVRLPTSLIRDEEFLANLVVVLDVAAAEVDPATETMFVPFYLDLKDRARGKDFADLALVEIDRAKIPDTRAEFRKR
ncbi:MAG: hypothetical protein ACHQ1G_02110 [Planctomycetota bacterium]